MLSRGRASNRLYVAAQPDDDRAEFAPVLPEQRDPVERHAVALRDSEGQVLAIDSGAVAASEERLEAERVAERAARERRALEDRRRQWLPGRRRGLEAARARESAAMEVVVEARRREAEAGHSGRSFVTDRELEAQRDASLARMADRMTERVLQRNRGIGREL